MRRSVVRMMLAQRVSLVSGAVLTVLVSTAALAQGYSSAFAVQSGAEIYHRICQGCHMPEAQGATGAGSYPALAANRHLKAALYPVAMVINGHKAMPAFGDALTDEQIAAVVNFVRSHFGNQYKDTVTPQMVSLLRAK